MSLVRLWAALADPTFNFLLLGSHPHAATIVTSHVREFDCMMDVPQHGLCQDFATKFVCNFCLNIGFWGQAEAGHPGLGVLGNAD